MNTWWNRFVSRARGHSGWATPGSNGTMALVLDPPVADTVASRVPGVSGGAMEWIRSRFSLRKVSARTQLYEAVTKLTSVVEVLEQRLERQQTRIDEIAAAVRTLAADLASLPSATLEQKRNVERLCESVTAHRGETAQLGTFLADVPASLRRAVDSLDSQGLQLASHGQGLGRLVEHAGAVEQTHSEIRDFATQIGRSQEQHARVIESFVSERRRLENDLNEMVTRTSRRLTAMVGVAIALATASAAFGVVQLFLKLTS